MKRKHVPKQRDFNIKGVFSITQQLRRDRILPEVPNTDTVNVASRLGGLSF